MYENEFPILKEEVNGNKLVYFDNAASSQKPQSVINSIVNYYSKTHSNVHRGAHFLSQNATNEYEKARKIIASHINSKENEVIFTKGTTHSLNIFARSIEKFIFPKDEILISVSEHHSNLVVFQELAKRTGAILKYIPLTNNQEFDYDKFEKLINTKTKLISLALISNVLGEKLDINKIKKITSFSDDLIVCFDCAQVLGHEKIDFSTLGADIITFSAHKAYGPTGIGALVIKNQLIKKLQPVEYGGAMIEHVDLELSKTTYKQTFEKFEPGTPDICGAIAFSEAINFIESANTKKIEEHEKELITYFFNKASQFENLKIVGTQNTNKKAGVISFYIENKNSYDIATLLDLKGIAIREGSHCTQPLLKELEIDSLLRVSFAMYNSKEEIDYFFESLEIILQII